MLNTHGVAIRTNIQNDIVSIDDGMGSGARRGSMHGRRLHRRICGSRPTALSAMRSPSQHAIPSHEQLRDVTTPSSWLSGPPGLHFAHSISSEVERVPGAAPNPSVP